MITQLGLLLLLLFNPSTFHKLILNPGINFNLLLNLHEILSLITRLYASIRTKVYINGTTKRLLTRVVGSTCSHLPIQGLKTLHTSPFSACACFLSTCMNFLFMV